MEEVTVQEILDGIHNPAFASQRLPLLEMLTNKLGDPICNAIVAVENEKKLEKVEDDGSHLPPAPATFSTTMSNSELEPLFKTLLMIIEKTSCKTLQGRKVVNMTLCALSNSTITEAQVNCFLQFTGSTTSAEGSGEPVQNADTQLYNRQFHHMIRKYLEYNPQLEDGSIEGDDWIGVDEWQYGGNVLTNLCQVEDGRRVILKQSSGYMEALPVQVSVLSS